LLTSSTGASTALGQGQFYALMAGEDASEIVGVVVVEVQDPRFDDVSTQESGGFIVYR